MRLPELTSRIREALLDRHAQVNRVESIMASRKVTPSRDRKLEGRGADELARASRVVRRENPEADQQSEQEEARQGAEDPDGHRGRFVDVEV